MVGILEYLTAYTAKLMSVTLLSFAVEEQNKVEQVFPTLMSDFLFSTEEVFREVWSGGKVDAR
jgi:hypothetical protein